jgi:hypothetical protein
VFKLSLPTLAQLRPLLADTGHQCVNWVLIELQRFG